LLSAVLIRSTQKTYSLLQASAKIPVGVRLSVVVLEMVLGIIIGPQVLGLAPAEGLLGWLGGKLGLAALFFMAGMELDLERVRGRPLTLAIRGWLLSLVLGLVAAALLYVLPIMHSPMMVGLALSTTALGTLLPILRDAGQLETEFGRLVLAAGAVGEFGPVVMVSLALTGKYSEWLKIGLMLMFVAIAFGAARIALGARPPRVIELLTRTMESSSPLPVRLSLLLLAVFVVLSENFGFLNLSQEPSPPGWSSGWPAGARRASHCGTKWKRSALASLCLSFS
jgi:Kef-type K+ transport system membrane component KefB